MIYDRGSSSPGKVVISYESPPEPELSISFFSCEQEKVDVGEGAGEEMGGSPCELVRKQKVKRIYLCLSFPDDK